MLSISTYTEAVIDALQERVKEQEPLHLYQPITYILQLGGKRLRPVLTLLTTDIFGGSYTKALDAALAIEIFHNFSLVHDDIMDAAPLRRTKPTVHEKWDINTGILSGDAMLILAYQFLEGYDASIFKPLSILFSKTALEVCKGQQYDVDFETRTDVTLAQYIKMITYKTAVLVGAAMQMGAIIAGAKKKDQQAIYDFGVYLGIAFQLQDDYLDAFGDPKTFGKQVAGDIIENKKTYLYLIAKQKSNAAQKQTLDTFFTTTPIDPTEKIAAVKTIFLDTKADIAIKEKIQDYTQKAFTVLDTLALDADKKALLVSFGKDLMHRSV